MSRQASICCRIVKLYPESHWTSGFLLLRNLLVFGVLYLKFLIVV